MDHTDLLLEKRFEIKIPESFIDSWEYYID